MIVAAAALSFLATLGHAARADELGEKGDFAFSADRLTGLYLYKDNDGKTDVTSFGLLGTPPLGTYQTARLGFDWFPIKHLSIGGALSYWSLKQKGLDNTSELLIAPRIGYEIPISRRFGFWPRGGITYRSHNNPDEDEVALTIEAMFYAAPADHFAFIFGPLLDLGLAGKGPESTNIGILTGGIVGWI
jgi:hypothetical protein